MLKPFSHVSRTFTHAFNKLSMKDHYSVNGILQYFLQSYSKKLLQYFFYKKFFSQLQSNFVFEASLKEGGIK